MGTIACSIAREQARIDQHALDWNGDYNGEACENCSRERVMICSNGKRRCEKCGWSPEEGEYVPESIY